jgi:hypothetical protein
MLHLHSRRRSLSRIVLIAGLTSASLMWAVPLRAGPWAEVVDSYDPGLSPTAGFTDPTVALGSPERFTGEGVFPGAVTMFNPPFAADEIVSIGEGGQLTVQFGSPVVDDPAHPFGIDLIIFGNSGFIDGGFPNGQMTTPATLFGADFATVEVSADGANFFPIGGMADALFPTQGYLDVSPFQGTAGNLPTDFRKPMDPSLTLSSFDGLTYADALALYDGSGGGTPIDIAGAGLGSISYVRVSVPDDGNATTFNNAEIDAFAIVPEPGTLGLVLLGVVPTVRRSRPNRSTRGS